MKRRRSRSRRTSHVQEGGHVTHGAQRRHLVLVLFWNQTYLLGGRGDTVSPSSSYEQSVNVRVTLGATCACLGRACQRCAGIYTQYYQDEEAANYRPYYSCVASAMVCSFCEASW